MSTVQDTKVDNSTLPNSEQSEQNQQEQRQTEQEQGQENTLKQDAKPIKKRPRPANLDLKSSNHSGTNLSQYALKCLSPGLPPLDPAMQSTFLISKSIEQQQRQLIASRQTPTGLTAPLESLSIPSSTKRLKRNAPPPLNLSSTTPVRPAIMSAPSHHYNFQHQYFTPHTASKATFYQANNNKKKIRVPQYQSSFTPMTPYGIRKPLMTSIPYTNTYMRNGIKTGVPKSAIPPRSGVPRTAGAGGALNYRMAGGYRVKKPEESASGVVDVFSQGERMAPLVAQPLSAQREFFDHGELNLRPTSGRPKSARPPPPAPSSATAASYKSSGNGPGGAQKPGENKVINEENELSDVESNAIEPEAEVGLIRKPEVDGELRILNNVFKFGFERIDDEKDKKRFLNHCSRAWEEFVKLGN